MPYCAAAWGVDAIAIWGALNPHVGIGDPRRIVDGSVSAWPDRHEHRWGNEPDRDREAATPRREQISEHLVANQPKAMLSQEPVDGVCRHQVLHQRRGVQQLDPTGPA